MDVYPGERVLNGQRNRHFEAICPGHAIAVTSRFVDVIERDTKRGPIVFFHQRPALENQAGALVGLGEQTTHYH
jgi:hypothetical protein